MKRESEKKERYKKRTRRHFCFSSEVGGGKESRKAGKMEIGNRQTKVIGTGPLTEQVK